MRFFFIVPIFSLSSFDFLFNPFRLNALCKFESGESAINSAARHNITPTHIFIKSQQIMPSAIATALKIAGVKHYIWFIIDSETRFVIGFHLSPHRDSPQAVSLFSEAVKLGKPSAVVSDRYSAYKVPVKSVFDGAKHIRVQSFEDDISNNLIECFNNQFKAWYKTKQGFSSFESANNLISLFVFFFNFVRPHSALNGLTPAQVAGLNLSKQRKREFLLVA